MASRLQEKATRPKGIPSFPPELIGMNWYAHIQDPRFVKLAEVGHGDTLHGQFLGKERERLTKKVREMRRIASSGGPDSVLPRWRPDVRRRMLLLPPSDRIGSMSAYELRIVDAEIQAIDGLSRKFNARRMQEVLGA